jgi:hypothetical protein
MPDAQRPALQLTLPGVEGESEAASRRRDDGQGEDPSDQELACLVAFTRARGIGPMRFGKLLSFFGDAATGTEGTLLALLAAASEPQHIDELCRASALPIAEVSGALVMMELKGMVQQVGAMTDVQACWQGGRTWSC